MAIFYSGMDTDVFVLFLLLRKAHSNFSLHKHILQLNNTSRHVIDLGFYYVVSNQGHAQKHRKSFLHS